MISGTARIAVSLAPELLAKIERLRRKTGENRSALVQRALLELLGREQRARRVERYVAGYREAPETRSEVMTAQATATALLASEPWE